MSIGIGAGGGSHLPPAWGATPLSGQTVSGQAKFDVGIPEEDPVEALARAVEEWKDRMLKGLNALTEDEIKAKAEEFRAFLTHENATDDELAEIEKLVQQFESMLRRLAESQHTEALITAGEDPEEEYERSRIAGFLRSKMPYNPMQTPREPEHTGRQAKRMAGLYESMLSS